MLQVGVDSVNELGDTVDGQPFELPFVEFTEEAFHDVGPGGSSGDGAEPVNDNGTLYGIN